MKFSSNLFFSSADYFHQMKLLDSGLLDTGTKTTFSHYYQILIITIFFSESVCMGGGGGGWGVGGGGVGEGQMEIPFSVRIDNFYIYFTLSQCKQ